MTNEKAAGGIIFLTLFFIIEYMLVLYGGAGTYITAPEIIAPPQPALSIVFAAESLVYFLSLWYYNGAFGIFNTLLLVPYFLMIYMYVISVVRGN